MIAFYSPLVIYLNFCYKNQKPVLLFFTFWNLFFCQATCTFFILIFLLYFYFLSGLFDACFCILIFTPPRHEVLASHWCCDMMRYSQMTWQLSCCFNLMCLSLSFITLLLRLSASKNICTRQAQYFTVEYCTNCKQKINLKILSFTL
jgi:hypothetical protein